MNNFLHHKEYDFYMNYEEITANEVISFFKERVDDMPDFGVYVDSIPRQYFHVYLGFGSGVRLIGSVRFESTDDSYIFHQSTEWE